jgi:integrase
MAVPQCITPSSVVPKPRVLYRDFRARSAPTVGDLIRRYLKEIDPIKPFGQTHRYALEMLAREPIAAKVAAELGTADVIEHCRARRTVDRVCAATVTQDLTYLRGPLGYASVGWGMQDVTVRPIKEALPMLEKLQLVGKSRPRDRRPDPVEYDQMYTYLLKQDQDPRSVCKMAVMMEFAVWSCRRISEICRIRWDDVNHEDRTYLIRDMKDPRVKKGNHFLAPALGKAWDLIVAQPKVDERIFPWDPKSAGARASRGTAWGSRTCASTICVVRASAGCSRRATGRRRLQVAAGIEIGASWPVSTPTSSTLNLCISVRSRIASRRGRRRTILNSRRRRKIAP